MNEEKLLTLMVALAFVALVAAVVVGAAGLAELQAPIAGATDNPFK